MSSPTVLKVEEGVRADGQTHRLFSVVLDQRTDDLVVVAMAVDPKTAVAIPREGSVHPDSDELIAAAPVIHAVGMSRDGVVLQKSSRFWNVLVNYEGESHG